MRVGAARAVSLAAYLGLIAWVMLWIVFLGEVAEQHISLWLLLFVPPLLLPLRGVLAGRDKALVWGTLVGLAYFVHGGVVAWSEPALATGAWLGGGSGETVTVTSSVSCNSLSSTVTRRTYTPSTLNDASVLTELGAVKFTDPGTPGPETTDHA